MAVKSTFSEISLAVDWKNTKLKQGFGIDRVFAQFFLKCSLIFDPE